MRIGAIAMVKNEGDVIEAFVRHSLAFVDFMIIADDASADDTGTILQSLADEGLPLHIRSHVRIGKYQAACTTDLLRAAVFLLRADWVFLLDADEFIDCSNVRTVLAEANHQPLAVKWRTYCPTECDCPDEANPVIRIGHRRALEPEASWKIVVPADSLVDNCISVYQGNHFLVRDGQMIEGRPTDAIRLAHFPVRSGGQYATKTLLSAIQYAAMGLSKDVTWGTRSRRELDRFMADPDAFFADWRQAGLTFALPPTVSNPEINYDPLQYRGGPLRFTSGVANATSFWRLVVQHAMVVATALGVMNDQHSPPETQECQTINDWSRRLSQREEAYQTALERIRELQSKLEELGAVQPRAKPRAFRWRWGSRPAA